jgi:hypothetical protein
MKKILITGHTYGLGKFLYDSLKDDYYLEGIARSTGYDLKNHIDVLKIIDYSLNFDHILNVCKVSPAQTDLLVGIHQLWDQNKKYGKIISIGGLTTTFSWNLIRQADIHQTQYIADKHNLAKAHFDLSSIHPYRAQPQSVLIRPLNIGSKIEEGRKEPFVTEKDICDMVKIVLEKDYYISTIDMRKIECS